MCNRLCKRSREGIEMSNEKDNKKYDSYNELLKVTSSESAALMMDIAKIRSLVENKTLTLDQELLIFLCKSVSRLARSVDCFNLDYRALNNKKISAFMQKRIEEAEQKYGKNADQVMEEIKKVIEKEINQTPPSKAN